MLEEGRDEFRAVVREVPEELAEAKPERKAWSVLECIEHVAAVEARYLGWLAGGEPVRARPDRERELRLFLAMRSRLTKVEAPEAVVPRGRFGSLPEAMAEFEAVRKRSIEFARERGAGLYSIGMKHPYFGRLNGGELVRLMDGHARRHGEQIRETVEALMAPREEIVKAPRAKKIEPFRRDEPDLPAQLDGVEAPERVLAGEGRVSVEEKRLADVQAAGWRASELHLEGCLLERVQLAESEFGAAVWKDVRLVGCDLANVRAHRLSLVRVELIDCRLTGFSAAAVDWRDVLIRKGELRYAQMQGGVFRNCEFEGCNWEDADLHGGDLAGCVFRGCELARADLRGARLRETDFRQSEVEGLVVGTEDLEGAIVDAAQAMVFARLMGLKIV